MDGTILTGCTAHDGTERSTLRSACRPAGECHPGSVRACAICVASARFDHQVQPGRRASPAEVVRECPKPTVLAHPAERARAASCVVHRAPLLLLSLLVSSSGPFSPRRPDPSVHYSSRCSLPETATCAPLSFSLPSRSLCSACCLHHPRRLLTRSGLRR